MHQSEGNIFDRRFGDVMRDFASLAFITFLLPYIIVFSCAIVVGALLLDVVILLHVLTCRMFNHEFDKRQSNTGEDGNWLFLFSKMAFNYCIIEVFSDYCKMIVDFICGKKIE